jgi:hypothetical protein
MRELTRRLVRAGHELARTVTPDETFVAELRALLLKTAAVEGIGATRR